MIKTNSSLGLLHTLRVNGAVYSQSYGPGSSQTIETFNHDTSNLGRGDIGGPFYSTRVVVESTPGTYTYGSGRNVTDITPIIPSTINQAWSGAAETKATMDVMGTGLLANINPTAPVFNGATFLGELRNDGLPDVPGVKSWKERTLTAKQAGGEYLSLEFAWKPLVSDLKDFARAVIKSDEIVADYRNRANTPHHFLGGDATARILNTRVYEGNLQSRTGNGAVSLNLPGTAYSVTSERKWIEGVYRYYLPMGNDKLSQLRRFGSYARKLYGLELTPEVVWNLTPWSWALDWFGSTGDLLSNISGAGRDSFALQYCYAMHEKSYIRSATHLGGYGTVHEASVRKQRMPANPYGFGAQFESLSAKQARILVALGLSRGSGIPKG